MKKYPILILHGWNLDSVKYNPLRQEFEKRGYQVFCPDLPGFGSNKIEKKSYRLDDYVNFVASYLKKNKIRKTILIGHSFGGRVGIKLSLIHPEHLSGLILTGVPGFTPVPRAKILFFLTLAKIGKLILSLPFLTDFKDFFQKFLYRVANASDFYNTKENMRETFQNIVKEKLDRYLTNIAVPTLLIWGREDKIVSIDIAKKMLKVIRNSKLYSIEGGRHLVPATHPIEFSDLMERFVKSL